MIRLIFVALFVVLFLIIGIPVLGIEWLIGKVSKKTMDYSRLRLVQWAFNMIIKLAGIELTVIGEENISEGPVLYIGNHRSFFDIVITYARCKNLTGYIAKKEMLSIPLLRTWMKRLFCLFLDRENPKEGLKTILQAIDYEKHGISICIFPEGTRRPQPLPSEFKSGIWRLMREFPEVELIPVYIENLHRAMPKGVYIPVPTICSVHFGAPLEHSPDDPKEVFLTRARQAVIDLAQQQ